MSGLHALKSYCDGPDEVMDHICINNQRHPYVIISSPSFAECRVNRFRCSDVYVFVIMETVSAVIRASTNYTLQVSVLCYEYSYPVVMNKRRQALSSVPSRRWLVVFILHHFRGA
jgi:hypothetical protein